MATFVRLLQMENGNGKLLGFFLQTENGSFFLGRQTINGNQRLLFQQMCLSVLVYKKPFSPH
jgi:hypothetical protein